MSALLEATGISISFGGVQALSDVDLQIEPGQLVGLIGPNGAGKTTFIDAVTGFVPCAGNVRLSGEDITFLPPHARARRGLARTWQSIELFDDLTVRENLAVASNRLSLFAVIKETRSRSLDNATAIDRALELLDLESLGEALPADLPQGQRKLIGVARALAPEPQLLCLDEPGAGLDTSESEELGARLRGVVDSGTSILLVDHDMGLVLSICDHVFVLDFGQVIAQGPPAVVRRDRRVAAAYLGDAAEEVTS